jgi:hypothetical protein
MTILQIIGVILNGALKISKPKRTRPRACDPNTFKTPKSMSSARVRENAPVHQGARRELDRGQRAVNRLTLPQQDLVQPHIKLLFVPELG